MDMEQIKADYQFVFAGRQGLRVLEDIRRICGADEPLAADPLPNDRELLKRAVWLDVYNYISAMAEGEK